MNALLCNFATRFGFGVMLQNLKNFMIPIFHVALREEIDRED